MKGQNSSDTSFCVTAEDSYRKRQEGLATAGQMRHQVLDGFLLPVFSCCRYRSLLESDYNRTVAYFFEDPALNLF